MPRSTSKFHHRLHLVGFLLLNAIVSQPSLSQIRFLENPTPLYVGDDAGYLPDSPTRLKIDLSGKWAYKVSNGDEGTANLPASYDYVGEVSFERKFEINPDDLGKYQYNIVGLGVNYDCKIWVNGDFIANHIGGYTSFLVPIPDNSLQVGKENIIRVVTDNRLDPSKTIPVRHGVWGWRNYGGIYRHLFILATPRTFVSNVAVHTDLNAEKTAAKVRVQVSLEGRDRMDTTTRRFQVFAEVYEKLSNTLVATTAPVPVFRENNIWSVAKLECTIPSPQLWSLNSPNMYSLRTYLVDVTTKAKTDEYRVNFGVRKIEIVGNKILLNGLHQPLNGVIWYEDHESYGNALPHAQMEKDIILIKSLGATAIRFAHHPPHPYMISLCDRYGLLALEELPIHGVPASILVQEHFLELAAIRMREMIIRDRNQPSVLAWGLGDEFETSDPLARQFVEPLVAAARLLDSRPLYYGTRLQSGDACGDLVDMTALTLVTRDLKVFRKTLEDMQRANPQRLLILAKMGVEVQPDNNNGYSDPLSLQAQARYYHQHIQVAKEANVNSFFIWSYNDWKGDRPALTIRSGNPWLHTLGLVSSTRDKRAAYDAVRSEFTGGKPPPMPIGKNPSSSPVEFVIAGLVLLIGTAYMYNANRRFRESLNRSVLNTYNFFSDVRDQRIVTMVHGTFLGMAVSAGIVIVLASILYRFRGSITLDNLLSYILVSDNVKETIVDLILKPHMFLLVGTGVVFGLLIVLSLLVWTLAPLFRARIYPFHAYAVTMWSTPPLLVLVPVGMILYRLLEDSFYLLPTLILGALLLVWVFLRFLRGLSIVVDAYPVKVYTLGILSVIVMLAGLYLYFDYTQSASMYISSFYNDIVSKIR